MITDQGRWDDRDYYDEHFYDIMYDKITEGMKLTVDEMDNLVSAGLFDKEIVPHEEYLEVNDNNQKMRTIIKLHDKYFEIRWTQYTYKDSEFPNDPVEVRKKPKIVDDWVPVEKDGTKCKEFVSYGKRYRREMGAEQIMPLSTAIDIVESMFFKEIAERYFDSSNIKDKTAAADEVLRIYEILTVHQKRLVLQKILKKEDND